MTGSHKRKSPRLTNYDYSKEGAYFVTICTQEHLCLFGNVVEDTMRLNAASVMVATYFDDLRAQFPSVEVDCYVVMPNHIHAIFMLSDQTTSVIDIVQWFKSKSTNAYIQGVKTSQWPPFPGKLWQRSFYDHIVRNDADLSRIREYIVTNPAKWALDKHNPNGLS